MNTPILFLTFNRFETTKKVFNAIRAAKPPKLYISSDGPRSNKPNEEGQVLEVRDYLQRHIDWQCEVKQLFHDRNLGCKHAVYSALKWFFDQEEMGIILEDDCLPNLSFFQYCDELLIKYKDDTHVGMISGRNHLGKYEGNKTSYTFTYGSSIWGWATWRRIMVSFDVDSPKLKDPNLNRLIYNKTKERDESIYFAEMVKESNLGTYNSWDYPWNAYLRIEGMLSITPNNNMIENIGFGEMATHTKSNNSQGDIIANDLNFPLTHPENITPDRKLMALVSPIRYRNKLILYLKRFKILRQIYAKLKDLQW